MAGEDLGIDLASVPRLVDPLVEGAGALDAAGAGAPPVPDAGGSTAVVADALAGMSEAIGGLVAALGATADGVGACGGAYGEAESANCAAFESGG